MIPLIAKTFSATYILFMGVQTLDFQEERFRSA